MLRWAFLVTIAHCVLATRTSYRAAVYEHVIISPDDAEEVVTREEAFSRMSKNLQVFENQAAIAAEKGVDIIVFPEYGVTGFDHNRDSMLPYIEDIPDPKVDWIPCNNPGRFPDTKVLYSLSCMAKNNSMYLVANVGDIKKCDTTDSTCPSDGRYQLNTNVVFDPRGKLVARYHKLNLYDESMIFDPAPIPEYVTFETPFGLFGTVVCFDLMHFYPTQVLVSEYGVKNILVTSAWNVFYPFVFSTQMYSGLSKASGVNVIASNARSADYRMASSGMFGEDVSVLSDPEFHNNQGVLLIADLNNDPYEGTNRGVVHLHSIYKTIPRIRHTDALEGTLKEFGMNMTFMVLPSNGSHAVVCYESVCCAVNYKYQSHYPEDVFIVAATEFVMDYPGRAHLQICAVHRCRTRNLTSCGEGVESARSTFKHIKLQAFFTRDLVFPIVSTTPYNNITANTEKDNYYFDPENVIIESSTLTNPLHVFALLNSITQTRYSDRVHYNSVTDNGSGSSGPKIGGSTGAAVTQKWSVMLQIAYICVYVYSGIFRSV